MLPPGSGVPNKRVGGKNAVRGIICFHLQIEEEKDEYLRTDSKIRRPSQGSSSLSGCFEPARLTPNSASIQTVLAGWLAQRNSQCL